MAGKRVASSRESLGSENRLDIVCVEDSTCTGYLWLCRRMF